jgi:hypothetical protein
MMTLGFAAIALSPVPSRESGGPAGPIWVMIEVNLVMRRSVQPVRTASLKRKTRDTRCV